MEIPNNLFKEFNMYKWISSALGSGASEIVKIQNDGVSYGIYDHENHCFIGFRGTAITSGKKVKYMWAKPQHASCAFNNAFGHSIKNQSRYEVRLR